MKKFGLILIIFLIITFGLSAAVADSSELHMSTSVAGVSHVVVSEYNSSTPSTWDAFTTVQQNPTGTSDNPFLLGVQGESYNETADFSIYVATNVPGSYSVTTTAEALTTGPGGYVLPYSVQIGGANPVVVNDTDGEGLTLMSFTVNESDGLKIEQSSKVILTVAQSDYFNAGSGEYSSTWTIELIKN